MLLPWHVGAAAIEARRVSQASAAARIGARRARAGRGGRRSGEEAEPEGAQGLSNSLINKKPLHESMTVS